MIHVEVWSDIVCPFCYIGKRHLEMALAGFPGRDRVRVTWRSFQLDPEAERDPGLTTHQLLAKKYGRTAEGARQMTAQVERMAEGAGLKLDLAAAVQTNSFDAHRLVHLAARSGRTDALQDAMIERLFRAHFVEGRHIGDLATLRELGVELGLDGKEIDRVLAGEELSAEVLKDLDEASDLSIQGVPFFVFDRKFAVSGAQPVEVFLRALTESGTAK